MYSLLCFLSVWSLDLYLKQSRESSSLRILWALVNLALVMVHVAGLAVLGCELVHAALVRKGFWSRFQPCLPALLAIALFFTNVSFVFSCDFLPNGSLLWADCRGPGNSKCKSHTLDNTVALQLMASERMPPRPHDRNHRQLINRAAR